VFVDIRPNNGLAIYDQVVRQVKFGVAQGRLRPGERVPSVRELSKQLTINPNTVARAYRQLQDEGVLESVRGLGLQVTSGAGTRCQSERLELIRERLRDVLREARDSGLSREAIERLFAEELGAPAEARGPSNQPTN
jgi:GntR family transcriptional regulator